MIRKTQKASLFAVLFMALFGCVYAAVVLAEETVKAEVVLDQKTGFYPGREIGMEIKVGVLTRLHPEIAGEPELELDNARLVDFSSFEQPFPGFYAVRREQREKDGDKYSFFIFSTRIVFLSSGTLTVRGEVPLSLLKTDDQLAAAHPLFKRRVGDWLSARRREGILVEFKLPPKEVQALPSLPADGKFLGLVGDWQVKAGIDRQVAQLNEAVELTIEATGDGSPEFFQTPALELRRFDIRGPQVDLERLDLETGQVTASWWLTPVETTASLEDDFVWLTFCPVEEAYVEHVFYPDLRVLDTPPPVEEPLAPEVLPSTRLSPLKRQLEAGMKRPWWREGLGLNLILGLIGVAGLAAAAVQARRREIRAGLGDAGLKREQALKRRRRLLKKLEKADPEQLLRRMKEEMMPWLRDLMQMPPGTTVEELAEELEEKDPELAEILKLTEHGEYDPRLKKKLDKEKVISRLRKFSRLPVFFFILSLPGLNVLLANEPGSAEEGDVSLDVAAVEEGTEDPGTVFLAAIESFQNDDFRRAEKLFASLERADEVNSTLLYNRGNCAWHQGEPWRALVFYERARRAAPRDMRIRHNLDLVRRYLNLPPAGSNTPFPPGLIRIRDYLRPDEWLGLAAAALAGLGVTVYWRTARGRRIAGVGPVLNGLLLILFSIALAVQLTSTYRPRRQGVVLGDTPLRAAPSSAAEEVGSLSSVGREVFIQKRHPGWVRVRSFELEGWLPRAEVAPLWGAGRSEGEAPTF